MPNDYKFHNIHYFVKVLVIENIFYAKKTISKILTDAGYFVFTASSSEEAIAKIIKYSPDLITISTTLSDTSGKNFIKKYKEKLKEKKLKVLFVTSTDDKDEGKTFPKGTIDEFIFKPIDEGILLSKIRKLFPVSV